MNVLLIILLAIGAVYCLLIYTFRTGWLLTPEAPTIDSARPATTISVIIPARNEASRIGDCLTSIVTQNYPKELLEVIVVDDHSEDHTAEVVATYSGSGITLIKLQDHLNGTTPKSYKKAALDCGIRHSNGELIVTTDADCTANPNWLQQIALCYEQDHPQMIVSPVVYSSDNSILSWFQTIDFMTMQGITFASNRLGLGRMCNGANLAFTRKAFDTVGGYAGVDHLVSGDDYLLMMKIAQQPNYDIKTLKSKAAIVYTPAQPTWRDFLSQRIRWASKSGKYPDNKLTSVLLLVYLFNLSILVSTAFAFIDVRFGWAALALSATKILVEYWFISPVAMFFGVRNYTGYFVLLQPLHILYILIAGFLGYAGEFEWKGRRSKQ